MRQAFSRHFDALELRSVMLFRFILILDIPHILWISHLECGLSTISLSHASVFLKWQLTHFLPEQRSEYFVGLQSPAEAIPNQAVLISVCEAPKTRIVHQPSCVSNHAVD